MHRAVQTFSSIKELFVTQATQNILQSALALPETERALLVDCLLETLPPKADDTTEDELLAELERRYEEFQRDPSSGILWSEIKRRR